MDTLKSCTFCGVVEVIYYTLKVKSFLFRSLSFWLCQDVLITPKSKHQAGKSECFLAEENKLKLKKKITPFFISLSC